MVTTRLMLGDRVGGYDDGLEVEVAHENMIRTWAFGVTVGDVMIEGVLADDECRPIMANDAILGTWAERVAVVQMGRHC